MTPGPCQRRGMPMPSLVLSVRSSEAERDHWADAASAQGLDLSAWARRALNEAADLEAVLRRQQAELEIEEGIPSE
jgi:hypothetical protein